MSEIPKNRILIVEDDTDIQLVLSFFLQQGGFETRTAVDGQEAIRIIPEFCPHLIILDLVMRPVSGWEVLQWLRVHHPMPPLPVLIISALFNLREQVHGFEEGAIEYLTKPTQPGVIVEHVRTLLALSAEQRTALRQIRMNERRKALEHIHTPLPDEFVY